MKEIFPGIGGGSTAGVGARVGEAAGGRDEPPVVAVGVERELQHTEGMGPADLAVRRGGALEVLGDGSARPDDELSESGLVEVAGRVLAGEALVDVAVPRQHQVGTGRLEVVPDG